MAPWTSVDRDPTTQAHPLGPLLHAESYSQDATHDPQLAVGIGPVGSSFAGLCHSYAVVGSCVQMEHIPVCCRNTVKDADVCREAGLGSPGRAIGSVSPQLSRPEP